VATGLGQHSKTSRQKERYEAWWQLRAHLARRLPHAEFIELLARLKEPLRLLLDDSKPSPKMAFDVKPKPQTVEVSALFHAEFVRGDYDRETNQEIEEFIARIRGTQSSNSRESKERKRMRETRIQLFKEGRITTAMTIKEQHRLVLEELGIDSDQRNYGYEIFRRDLQDPKSDR
jgi:hypothetical protein